MHTATRGAFYRRSIPSKHAYRFYAPLFVRCIAACKSNLVFSFHSTPDLSDGVLCQRSRQLSVAFHSNSVSFISREAAAAMFTNWSSLKIMNQAYLMWLTACMGTKLKYYPLFFTKIMPRPHPTIFLSKHQRR